MDDFSLELVSLNSKSGMLWDRNVALMINLSISLHSLNELFELLRLNTKERLQVLLELFLLVCNLGHGASLGFHLVTLLNHLLKSAENVSEVGSVIVVRHFLVL